MLGFVNYKCYHELSLIYPPKLSITKEEAKVEDKFDENDFNDEVNRILVMEICKV